MIEVTVNYRDLQTMMERPSGVPVEEHVSYDIIMGSLIRRKLLAAGIPVLGVLWAFTVHKGVLRSEATPDQIIYRWYANEDEARAKTSMANRKPVAQAETSEEDL